MNKFNELIGDSELLSMYERMDELESDRIYCRHGITHSLDVARIGYIMMIEEEIRLCDEEKLAISDKELIYITALLHDLGRIKQYEDGESHHKAGVEIAKHFLEKHGFDKRETELILDAIASHKHGEGELSYRLSEVLYRADKLSRNCFSCEAADTCYWENEKRNMKLMF